MLFFGKEIFYFYGNHSIICINPVYELLDYIEYLRKNLIYVGLKNGFNHEKTIGASQKLDHFILEYQKITSQTNNSSY